jgi:uncharacterized membrane protein YbhN (UPF0104 family)
LFYVASLSFHLRIPLSEMLAFTPVLLIASGQPFTPSGLGTLQLAFVAGFSRFAPKEDLIAMALGINVIHILTRIPLGLSAAGSFAHSVLMIHGKGRGIQSSRHRSGTRLGSHARAGRPESSRS